MIPIVVKNVLFRIGSMIKIPIMHVKFKIILRCHGDIMMLIGWYLMKIFIRWKYTYLELLQIYGDTFIKFFFQNLNASLGLYNETPNTFFVLFTDF